VVFIAEIPQVLCAESVGLHSINSQSLRIEERSYNQNPIKVVIITPRSCTKERIRSSLHLKVISSKEEPL
jgi:hypothetical protein